MVSGVLLLFKIQEWSSKEKKVVDFKVFQRTIKRTVNANSIYKNMISKQHAQEKESRMEFRSGMKMYGRLIGTLPTSPFVCNRHNLSTVAFLSTENRWKSEN